MIIAELEGIIIVALVGIIAALSVKCSRLKKLVEFDYMMVNLHNKAALLRAKAALERFAGYVGVIYIDVNSLRAVNTLFSHDVADIVLKNIGSAVASTVEAFNKRSTGKATAYRYGGDELAIIVKNASKIEIVQLERDLKKIRVRIPGETKVFVSISVGYAFFEGGHALGEKGVITLCANADLSMYADKRGQLIAYGESII